MNNSEERCRARQDLVKLELMQNRYVFIFNISTCDLQRRLLSETLNPMRTQPSYDRRESLLQPSQTNKHDKGNQLQKRRSVQKL